MLNTKLIFQYLLYCTIASKVMQQIQQWQLFPPPLIFVFRRLQLFHIIFQNSESKRFEKLFSLSINKPSGLDGIPAILLKKGAPELAPILTYLFQSSYYKDVFSDSWKTACLQHIPKKSSRLYLPIIDLYRFYQLSARP